MLGETLSQHDPSALGVLDPEDAAVPFAEAVDALPADVNDRSILGLAEMLLKAPALLDARTLDPARQPELIPRLLVLSLTGVGLFSVVLVLLLRFADAAAVPEILGEDGFRSLGEALALGLAYPVGMVAASGICLPTFYFFGLLAGVRASVLQVTTHVLKGKAATSIFLLGLLPIYLAATLGMLIFHADTDVMSATLGVGLALPFLSGLWGVHSLYVGFLRLADTLPPERRCRRTCFLRRLTVAWAAVYTVVTPVMIWSLYNHLAANLRSLS